MGAAVAQSSGPVNAPAVKVGDRWTFKRTDRVEKVEAQKIGEVAWEVVAVDDKTYEVRATLKGRESAPVTRILMRDGGLLVDGTLKFEPFQPVLSFPLEQGKEWSGRYKYPSPTTSETVDAQLSGKAVEWESVTVPAGTYKALKIRYSGRWGMMRGPYRIGGEFDRTGWYVPELRQWVRFDTKTFGANAITQDLTLELVSFKLAD
jgi:hypothetical protein